MRPERSVADHISEGQRGSNDRCYEDASLCVPAEDGPGLSGVKSPGNAESIVRGIEALPGLAVPAPLA
jgi:hypothetical protein